MNQPLVSVIIPLYNSERHIAETLDCIYNQTYSNIEVIVIDDGSEDNSYEIANSLKNKNTIVLRQSNKGASAARNRGLNVAKGKYIQYLDADDLISSNKIENQVNLLEKNINFLSICDAVYFNDNENYLLKTPEKSWLANYYGNNIDFITKLYGSKYVGPNFGGMVVIHSWLCPKELLLKAGFWNESLSMDDDGEYFCRVILASEGICFAKEGVSYYRKHQNAQNLSAQLTYKGYKSMLLATQLKYNHLKSVIEIKLLNKVFIDHFEQITIATFPKFEDISKKSLKIAKSLGLKKVKYKGGPLSTLLAKLIGWKIIRKVNYLRYGF
jgi:glycosyltransferase involved in cell wall biosynthesis